jgi:hypothetical protein
MNLSIKKRRLLILLPLAIALSTVVIVIALLFSQQNNPPHVVKPTPQKLPDDVERVMEGYTYRETDNGLAIDLSGNRVIFRGRQVLGLRSNLIKSTYFETIRGTLRTRKTEVKFSASDAEWNTKPSSPLLLRKNVLISVNDKPIPGVKTARIYFQQKVVEVIGDRKQTVLLR